MSVVEGTQIPVDILGGLVTNIDPQSLPMGVSPDCADVAFKPGVPGTVQTRPGLSLIHTFPGNPSFTYFATYTDLQGNNRGLYLDSNANLWEEFPQGTFSQILEQINGLTPGAFAKSDTAFGSEFIAFSDGKFGLDIPRRLVSSVEQSTTDRLSQVGPGAGPTGVADIAFTLLSISRTSGIITGTINVPLADSGLVVGGLITIQGVNADGTFNGSFPIISLSGTTTTTFTAWGVPGTWNISSLLRVAGVVTAVLQQTPTFSIGDTIIVGNAGDPSFDGEFTVTNIDGNEVTWVQAGPDDTTQGGTLYNKQIQLPVVIAAGNTTNQGFILVSGDQTSIFSPGQQITVAGNSTSFWNNNWIVQIVQLTQKGAFIGDTEIDFFTSSTASLGYGGTVTISLPDSAPAVTGIAGPAGNISSGEHQISVVFITRNGYFTAPPKPIQWVATGQFKALASGIPVGPPNVLARLLTFTAANGANYFFSQAEGNQISNFLISDNTTTSLVVDFSDLALLSETSADLLFNRIELPECAAILQFADRMFAWGARNRVENFVNMSFDGGVRTFGGPPLGWTVDPTYGGGGFTQDSSIFGFDYVIAFAGTVHGMLTQGAYQDYLKVAILSPLKFYGIRVWLSDTNTQTGTFTVDIYSSSIGVIATATVNLALVNFIPTEFIVPFDNETPATIPTDAILRVYANQSSGSGNLVVKNLEVYPLDEPYQTSVLLASNAADPEAFDGVTGFLNVNENDGRRITAGSVIRDRLYVMKNIGGMFVTTDDASNEPSDWTLDTISRQVGAESINSMGVHLGTTGEDWIFIINRQGLYIFWSSEPPKISQEIQPTWDLINFDALFTGWIAVDTKERRVLIGVPTGSATSPNKILQMDYKSVGMDAETVSIAAPVKPTYTGQEKAHSSSRKWSIWNRAAAYGGFIERSDGQAHMFSGNNLADGVVSEFDESALVDYDGPIPGGGYYVTSGYPSDEQKQQLLQMKGNRVLQRYMTLQVNGSGQLQIEALGPGFVNTSIVPIVGAPPLTLSNPSSQDMETYFNFGAERIFNKITNLDDETPWWSLENLNLYHSADPVSTVRGYN